MSTYRIVCTNQEPASQPPTHAHIVAVGVGDDSSHATNRFTLGQVLSMMTSGDIFFTKGIESQKIALVEKYWCTSCSQFHIRSAADSVKDNNLDNLRYCQWSK
jgi:hypothetical protein